MNHKLYFINFHKSNIYPCNQNPDQDITYIPEHPWQPFPDTSCEIMTLYIFYLKNSNTFLCYRLTAHLKHFKIPGWRYGSSGTGPLYKHKSLSSDPIPTKGGKKRF
jgi:hypothetical protein